jgi:hypothetical protein
MLRFESRPDPVFTAILHGALTEMQDWIEDLPTDSADERSGWWRAQYPHTAARFTPEAARAVIESLLVASHSAAVYDLTEYHWLLIYDALKIFCDIHNDYVWEDPSGLLPVGPYRIGQIDFVAIIDDNFFDLDCLTDPADLDAIGEAGRREMGMRPEVFGVVQGLTPHPEELELTRWPAPEGWWELSDPMDDPPRDIPVYPPEPGPDD